MRQPRSATPLASWAACALIAVCLLAGPGWCQPTSRDVNALAKASLIYIATVRKDGNQSKAAPVWFTTTTDHMVLIQTGPTTWKAKRIRRGSPVIVWIGAENGPAFIGASQITNDPGLQAQIIRDYPERYLLARLGFARPSAEKFAQGKVVSIRITVVRDLPDGFVSEPGKPAPKLTQGGNAPATPSSR